MRLPRILVTVVVLFGLVGCAFSDPRLVGTPPTASHDEQFALEATTSAHDLQAAWSAVAAMGVLEPENPKWTAMASTLESLWLVMKGPDPLNRIPAILDIGEPFVLDDYETTRTSAQTALVSLLDTHLDHAKASTGVESGMWGSLAASLAQLNDGFTGSYEMAVPANPDVTLMQIEEATALQEVITRCDEGVFVLESIVGFLPEDHMDHPQYEAILVTLKHDLDTLLTLAAARNIEVEAPGAYTLPSGRDSAAAKSLLATTQRSLVDSAAVWVVSAGDPSTALEILMHAATMGTNLGVGYAVWPGWPDSA